MDWTASARNLTAVESSIINTKDLPLVVDVDVDSTQDQDDVLLSRGLNSYLR
jgi:hypothetical protein